jgi:signal transduction histidine kinase
VKGRVAALIGLELLLVAAGLEVTRQVAAPPTATLLSAGVFVAVMVGLTLLPRIYLEHRRYGVWITPADGAIVVALFVLGPLVTVAAAMVAELLIALRFRQSPLKLVFNLVSMFGGYTAAAATFATLGRSDPLDPAAWIAALLALAACAIWDVLSTAGLFSVIEDRPFRAVLNGIGPALLASLVLSAALGLVGVVLVHEHTFGILLLVPVVAILVVSSRAVTRSQGERTRLERLYAASSSLAHLSGRDETLAGIAAEGRTLITGAAAICASVRGDGSWHAVLVDDRGPRPLSAAATARVLAATGRADQGAVVLDRALALELPDLPNLVWARAHGDGDVRLLVAVLLELPADEQGEHRADVLATFVAHAGAVVANVELHQDVQDALDRQLALNRQKTEFVAAVSHELRTPLASVIGVIQTVKRAGDRLSPEERDEVLDLGATQGTRLRSLIEDLLLVAAAEHQAVRVAQDSIDPLTMLEGIVADLPAEAQGRVTLDVAPVGAFLADHDKVRRIVLNLVDNARKYAPSGPIEVTVRREDATVVFTVDDHGPGISAEDRERVFERFVQLDGSMTRRQGGTGLGLHLSRELAELQDGTLTVGASASGGARFTLRLPQRRSQDLVEAITAPSSTGLGTTVPATSDGPSATVTSSPAASASRTVTTGLRTSPLRQPATAGAATNDGATT